jgi:hypothetical protein
MVVKILKESILKQSHELDTSSDGRELLNPYISSGRRISSTNRLFSRGFGDDPTRLAIL